MRTEKLLREAMDDLAATARTREVALPRILAALPTPAAPAQRNRRRVLVAALVAALLVLAVTVPTVLRRQTAEPAGRVAGNWNLIHRVADLPAGWEQGVSSVTATSETTTYGADPPGWVCSVGVLAQGLAEPSVVRGTAASVNGRGGYYGVTRAGQTEQLFWPYAEAGWASVSCDRDSRGGTLPGATYADSGLSSSTWLHG